MKIIVASPHKVGSTWFCQMLARLLRTGWLTKVPPDLRENVATDDILDLGQPGVVDFIRSLDGNHVLKSHALAPDWAARPVSVDSDLRFVSILRDPRDAVVSLCHYVANLPAELGGHPELLALSPQDRIRVLLREQEGELLLFESWAASAAFSVRYEDLNADPLSVVLRVVESLSIPVASDRVAMTVNAYRFKNLADGRDPGMEDNTSFYRKGIVGDWRNNFDKALVADFKLVKDGRWNALLMRLGYETDPDWGMQPA